ncbi:MAG: UDP-N-acetylmuramoyl-L-alanyl-D-glutamate--2,6-diaminopimelate ligase [Gammaproteobacteria bacterium]|nr:UDP-N-acetylmuramoyl-L-alanyl-D-glutamate--2,6-diaminopimelate ligase [Gammaproteobacteria bacterium]
MRKKLTDLLRILDISNISNISNSVNPEINNLQLDSRAVKPGNLFFAYPGTNLDGRDYVNNALDNGASFILYEPYEQGYNKPRLDNNNSLAVKNLSQYISQIAAEFYNNPSAEQNIYAITGTNGKTTCSYLIAGLLSASSNSTKVGVIGTTGYGEISDLLNNRINKLSTTTPDPILLQKILHDFQKAGIQDIVLEASSHALSQYRLSGVNIKTAIFTNLSHDHLDYHDSLEEYYLAKKKLFYFPSIRNIAINIDDQYGQRLLTDLAADRLADKNKKNIMLYSLNNNNFNNYLGLFAKDIKYYFNVTKIKLVLDDCGLDLTTKLMGEFNVYNLLAAIASLYINKLHINLADVILNLNTAPGRMERMNCAQKQVAVIIDYAHTPDALEQVLKALRTLKIFNKIWCVFGCGGDRDKTKRPEMGAVAARYADKIIITDDNPRTEDPKQITAEVVSGINSMNSINSNNYIIINDRKEAIKTALLEAESGDVVVIAGKGHEDYQIYGQTKLDYNERVFVRDLVKNY